MSLIIRKITKLQYLHMFIRKILTKTLFAQTFVSLSQSFVYPLSLFTNKPKPVEKPTSATKKYDSSVSRREKQIQTDHIIDQIIEVKTIMATMIAKQHRLQTEEKENIRKLLKNFNPSQLKSLNIQNLETILNFYVSVLEDGIVIPEPKLQHVLYQTFVKNIENMNLNRQVWKDIARVYRNISKLGIVYPNLHSKLPSIVVKLLNRKQQWDTNSFNLTNILVGLSNRQILLKDEKMAILSILSYYDKKYNQLDEKQKAYFIRTLVNLNSQNRFGIGTQQEQNILSKFLHDLETGKHNLWNFLSFTILQNNTYPTTHKTMDQITHIIVREALELLDAKGIIRGELKVKQMFNIITNFSTKYSINRLSQSQKTKLFQFLKKEIEGEETVEAQDSLSLMLSHNFFIDNVHALRLLLEHSQTFPMTVRLAFELTRVSLKVDSKHFIPIQSFQPRKIKIQMQNIIIADDLLILVIARMQLQINPKSEYYKQVCERYFGYFQSAIDQNYCLIISQIMKMPHTALYYMHKLFDLKSTFDLIDQKQVSNKYSIQNKFIYLLIKYNGLQYAQQFKWYHSVNIEQLIDEVLLIEMKIPASQRFYSTNLLAFFHSYIQKCFKNNSSSKYLRFCNIKNIIHYYLDLTRGIRQNGKVSYQSHTFTLYWQTINFLLHHIDDLQDDIQLKILFSQFLEILMFDSPSHFFTTHQFRAFLKRLLTVLEKIKPNYEAISKIVSRGILCGVITESNFSQISLIINIHKDLFGEIKQIGELWLMKQEKKASYESMHEVVKYFNSAKKYFGSQLSALKEEIRKYDIENLGKALQFYSLPVDQNSREIYYLLINELRSRKFINLVQNNFHSILANINRYLYGSRDINEILSEILKIHLSNFDEFTIEYHLDIVSEAGKMKVFDRDYERLLLATALRQSLNPFTAAAVVSCLARNSFGFNYKELRQLQTIMKTAKVSWLQVFLLLEDQLLPELRKDVLIHVLHHQKVYHPTKNETNNEYVHDYLEKKYPQIYQHSYFETLKKDKSYRNKSSYTVAPFDFAHSQ